MGPHHLSTGDVEVDYGQPWLHRVFERGLQDSPFQTTKQPLQVLISRALLRMPANTIFTKTDSI